MQVFWHITMEITNIFFAQFQTSALGLILSYIKRIGMTISFINILQVSFFTFYWGNPNPFLIQILYNNLFGRNFFAETITRKKKKLISFYLEKKKKGMDDLVYLSADESFMVI